MHSLFLLQAGEQTIEYRTLKLLRAPNDIKSGGKSNFHRSGKPLLEGKSPQWQRRKK